MCKIDWTDFEKGNLAVHCKTKEIAIKFLEECDKRGYRIPIGIGKNGENFYEYGEETCYRLSSLSSFTINYCSKGWYEEQGCYDFVEWTINDTVPKLFSNIKEGEMYKCGSKYIQHDGTKIVITESGREIVFNIDEEVNKIVSVSFSKAMEHMKQGGMATCLYNGYTHFIKDGALMCMVTNHASETRLDLDEIESLWTIEG